MRRRVASHDQEHGLAALSAPIVRDAPHGPHVGRARRGQRHRMKVPFAHIVSSPPPPILVKQRAEPLRTSLKPGGAGPAVALGTTDARYNCAVKRVRIVSDQYAPGLQRTRLNAVSQDLADLIAGKREPELSVRGTERGGTGDLADTADPVVSGCLVALAHDEAIPGGSRPQSLVELADRERG